MLRCLPLLAATALLFASCWEDDRVAGGGDATETGNAITARITFAGGQDAQGAVVSLVPADFNPTAPKALPDSFTRASDGNGEVRFQGIAPGRYNIQARYAATGARLLITGVAPRPDKEVSVSDSLRAVGSLYVPLPETRDSGAGYVYVLGSTYQVRVDAAARRRGRVLLDSLPAGPIPTLVYTKGDTSSPQIPVASEQVVVEGVPSLVPPFSLWAHSAKLTLNTTAAGVPITATVRDFPLLVRLIAPGFDFSQARGDGGDLRFADAFGAPLSYQLESWDSAAGHAEVWVRLDSVIAGSATQFLTMHWGSSQGFFGGGAPVFDTAAGFASVWHMSEEAADTIANGLYRDATQGGTQGNDRIKSTDRGGAIGFGHGFGEGDYVQCPLPSEKLRQAKFFTLSAWVKSLAATDSSNEIVSVGDNYGLRLSSRGDFHVWFWPPSATAEADSGWYFSDTRGVNYLDGAWHLAAGVFDGTALHLYVDGREKAVQAAPAPVDFKFPLKLTVGKHGFGKPGFSFTGNLDEIEVHSVGRNADWEKLSYENQKPGSTFPARTGP